MTYKILINTSKRFKKEVKLVQERSGKTKVIAKKEGDINITKAIQEILEENKIDLEDIHEVIPFLGPGSFTGLKLGVTIANTINWALGRKKSSQIYLPKYGAEPNIYQIEDKINN